MVGGVWSLPPVPQSADAAPQLAPQCRPLWSPCGPTCGQHCHLFLFSRGLSHVITSSLYGDSPSLLPAHIINIHCAPEREREVGLAWPGLVDNRCSSLPPPPRPFCQILKGTPAGMKEREFYCNQCSSQDQSDAEDIVGLAASSRCLNSDCNKSGYG